MNRTGAQNNKNTKEYELVKLYGEKQSQKNSNFDESMNSETLY